MVGIKVRFDKDEKTFTICTPSDAVWDLYVYMINDIICDLKTHPSKSEIQIGNLKLVWC